MKREPTLAELLKVNKDFNQVLEKEEWFDEGAKPRKKKLPPSEFDDNENPEEA